MDLQIVCENPRPVVLGQSILGIPFHLTIVLQQEITARASHSDCCATRTFLWFLAIRPWLADSPLPVIPVPARRTGVPLFTQRCIHVNILMK